MNFEAKNGKILRIGIVPRLRFGQEIHKNIQPQQKKKRTRFDSLKDIYFSIATAVCHSGPQTIYKTAYENTIFLASPHTLNDFRKLSSNTRGIFH